ncbi:Sensor protein CzcS precursor [compost metagenome]
MRLDVERAPAPVSGTACIRVTNAGPAIPPETLPHIFGRFYRADPSRRNSAASTGLGLAIVDTIMRLHGGSVTVRSVEGETMFSLQFPAEALATAAPPAPAPAAVS